jgi:hypothetical protein
MTFEKHFENFKNDIKSFNFLINRIYQYTQKTNDFEFISYCLMNNQELYFYYFFKNVS